MSIGSGCRKRRLKKYYSLTHKGKEVLEELIEFWANYESCVNGFIATYQQAEVS